MIIRLPDSYIFIIIIIIVIIITLIVIGWVDVWLKGMKNEIP